MNAQKALAILALAVAPTIAFAQSGNSSTTGSVGTGAAAQGTPSPDPKRAGMPGRTGKQQMTTTPDSSDLPPQPTPNIIRYR